MWSPTAQPDRSMDSASPGTWIHRLCLLRSTVYPGLALASYSRTIQETGFFFFVFCLLFFSKKKNTFA